MTQTLQNTNTVARFASGGAVLHVRFGGHSFDISLPGLDISPDSRDVQVKRAVAEFLNVPSYRLDDYVIDRHSNGNLTIRPEYSLPA
ncbi:MAG TPA: hypothetical protein VN541_07365 [Tepidisphaeraceae bacterium]|nr:hypothetical protein [Tepidisphaeraceae bacterium]